jgi:CheY-like chemotaxis protein
VSPRDGTVLVIDDTATARDALQKILNHKGFRARTAATGEEGLRLARELHPVVIMLDAVMPGMVGRAVLTALKAEPELADIPVVLFTGMADDRREVLRLGASDYVMKPVDPDRLTAILRRYCGSVDRRRALVVDDDSDLRQCLRGLLEKEGWEVDEAADGREALASLAKQYPGVILLDLIMPGMADLRADFPRLVAGAAWPETNFVRAIGCLPRFLAPRRRRLGGHDPGERLGR